MLLCLILVACSKIISKFVWWVGDCCWPFFILSFSFHENISRICLDSCSHCRWFDLKIYHDLEISSNEPTSFWWKLVCCPYLGATFLVQKYSQKKCNCPWIQTTNFLDNLNVDHLHVFNVSNICYFVTVNIKSKHMFNKHRGDWPSTFLVLRLRHKISAFYSSSTMCGYAHAHVTEMYLFHLCSGEIVAAETAIYSSARLGFVPVASKTLPLGWLSFRFYFTNCERNEWCPFFICILY